jgi:hypothetical protein
MGRRPITSAELDEHMNRRDELVFDYLVDSDKSLFIEELKDSITDVVSKDGVTYAVGQEVQHPVSKFAYAPWYEIARIYPVRRAVRTLRA